MHKLLNDSPGEKIMLLGNEAIARGAIEAGVAFATTYPGTPSSEISLNLFQMSQESDLYFEYSTNEKVALEVAAAAANSGLRTFCMMKHVGLNVAADPLMTLAYVGVTGGMVILSADDPAMFSSQNEQDNRYYAKFGNLPMLEPSSVPEAKEMMRYAFDLSEELHQPVLLRTTTRINHSNAFVTFGDMKPRQTKGEFIREPSRCVTVPAVSRQLHVKLLEKMEKAKDICESSDFNPIKGSGKFGIIANGVSFHYALDAVKDLGVEEDTKILQLGFSNPMPEKLIKNFLKDCKKVLVIEEGEAFMEETVKAFAQEEGLMIPINGKSETLFSRLSEYDPAMVRENIASYFGIEYTPREKLSSDNVPPIPMRPPNLCSGCSHRATFYEVKQAAGDMDIICPTDIGCYTLGFLPPLNTGDFVICMGSSVSTSCGFGKATDQKVVSFIGDSTFFHSGITGLVNAVFNDHNFTLVILENGTTAMTGHQPHPGVDMERFGLDGFGRVNIEKLVRALGVEHVSVIKPFKVKKSIETIREALEYKGVSVILSQEPCALYAKSLNLLKPRAFKVSDRCVDHKDCVNTIACPSFYIEDGRVKIDADTCVGCAVCAQICPENAITPVKK
ncbi:MAG: indolepyruvate ferredoxin oxidoreductase subunit alpha [Desulfobacula sp.]|jgi:indolepyruvate ferredoxin oxidoreductase alpha subunit|uniref:indolepyruvate ferredoxin oxidoreductase subunit alpha n=1 Tax=Desulfobacula sp. TaxID=2593537 RepID=UPI001E155ADF|nr:indolepyruvate ferredoxin oxidoreductase subunit alpha [Desulfobacula sp.]MBT4025078.1 indolepyruvate ferredoxin oxidoreductase subunit alpha [Desulfobacula sp.]MBT4198231.1 indolepyruvate ferredoxin oxidoreductase subunit alpha [Desulfobacula sp.]MBT5543874.1 indolepyruvate ferredoxin oxidoreductase subunit alpha [Desulfobacula sp.]MBT6747870.1 indolepyruvate ferredoxin oxidoreductase subunit alpha [Desulfobacula sp.]